MWEAKLPEVAEILQEGTKVARAKAQETMKDVRHAMKPYFYCTSDMFYESFWYLFCKKDSKSRLCFLKF